jgi:excisionase family DNA binding protein
VQDQTPLAVSIEDVCKATGLCRTVVYEHINSGGLRARKVGRRTVILADDLRAWLENMPTIGKAA